MEYLNFLDPRLLTF